MSILFVRRRNLGRGSVKGMSRCMKETGFLVDSYKGWLHNTNVSDGQRLVIRWGATPSIPVSYETLLNPAVAIHRVNNKKTFRLTLQSSGVSCPRTTTTLGDVGFVPFPMVVRPSHHSRGRNLWVVNNLQELVQVTEPLGDEWYASELINKKAEYRVYVVQGRAVTVAEKHPDDPTQVAWNVAQGGEFKVVRWGDWHLPSVRVAIEAMRVAKLDFGGVDVMVDHDGVPYVIEINSAPSLPFLSDGSVSYRQKCMAKAFMYIYDNGKDWIEPTDGEGWRDYIHPAIWSRE